MQENVITFARFWYLIKRTTNSTGIHTNWINCLLYEVLLTYTFFLYWTRTVPNRILVRYIEALCIFILIKIMVQCFDCKSPERVLLTGATSICKRCLKVHTGVKLSRMCGLSLLAIFDVLSIYIMTYNTLLYSKRKSSTTAAPLPLTTKLISKPQGLQASETHRY